MAVQTLLGHAKSNLTVLLFCVCVIFVCQGNSSLLDPTLIGNKLRTFARDAIGVDEMQVYFNGLQYHGKKIDGKEITQAVAIKLADKFKTRFKLAERLKAAVEASYARAGESTFKECCKADKSKLKYDVRFRSKVNLNDMCLKISGTASPNPVLLDEGFFREMKQISHTYPFVKWQYFGSEEGVLTNFPVYDDKDVCTNYDPRYRPFYVETATPEAKDVVLVIDTSGSMVGDKINIAREAANTVLETLNPKDQVGIVSFNNDVSTPGLYGGKSACYSERLALAIPANIRCLKNYVSSLSPHGQTQYRLAFEKAFSLFKSSIADDAGKPKKRVILFLTDGAPSEDEKPIFQTIRNKNLELNNSVVILTFGFGGIDQKTKEILQDIAEQNTTKHGVPANTTVGDITVGTLTTVQEIKTLRSKIGTYYNLFASGKQLDRPVVSVPYVDAFGTGLLISITLPCFHKGRFIGVTGTDMNIDDLISDISLFNQGQSAYAFMTSRQGRAIVHPLLSAPTTAYEDPVYLDIRTLEPDPEFNDVFDSMTISKTGYKTFVSKRFLSRGGTEKEGVRVRSVNSTYFWTNLEGTEFSLGVVVPVSYTKDELVSLQIPEGYQFKYHRIDLDPPARPCSHFGMSAAKDSAVVKFAPDAFKDRYKYIGLDETKADVDILSAYMNAKKGTVKNPGLKEGIRETVIATWKVEDLWLRHKTELTQYLVWRFIGTADGVFRLTPGSSSEKTYDPRQRQWYYTALANSGLVSLTTPYLDAGGPEDKGAGVVITAAKSLYLGEPNHKHHTNDDVLGVMGADFPLTYFYRLLIEVYPLCKERQTYSCFVMDNAGFLIMHEDFLLSSAKAADVEYVHITEKEKNIAEHLISRGYLKRKECRNLKDIRKQSFYEVDLPDGLVDVLQSGGSCSKYQLSQISGTNAYIGVAVRDSFCAAESCSCSSDNKCSYLSPKCECPCTSPLKFNYCRSQFPNSSLPICPPSVPDIDAPSNPSPPVPRKNCDKPGLEKCFDPHCSQRNSSQTCEGIASCFWCQYNKDDVPLTRPYCASSEVCFRGKEAEEKPNCGVTNQPSVRSPLKDRNWFSKLSTGAIAGFISGCIVFVAVIAAACILASRHLRNSKNTTDPTDPSDSDLANRPPAPLPKPAVPYVPEEQYEDPDELDRSRQSSVASIQWPSPYEEIRVRSSNKPLRIPLQERPHGIPPPPRLLQSSSGTVEPYESTPPPQLLQDRKISLDSAPSPSNFPHASVSRVETYGAGQPPVPNTTNATEGASPQSHLRGVPGDNPPPTQLRKISGTNPPPLHQISNDGSLNSQNTTQSSSGGPPELPKKQRTFVGPRSSPIIICGEQDTCSDVQLRAAEENTTSDHDASPSSNSSQGADQMAYFNLPPPLLEPRKDADGYMMPCIGPSQLTSNDSSTSLDSHGYLTCIA